jgi:hypothetical protein
MHVTTIGGAIWTSHGFSHKQESHVNQIQEGSKGGVIPKKIQYNGRRHPASHAGLGTRLEGTNRRGYKNETREHRGGITHKCRDGASRHWGKGHQSRKW